MVAFRALLCGALLALSARYAQAQVRRVQLPQANAAHSAEFTSITSVRELRDGRVLVTDGRETRIRLLDFARDASQDVGRRGRGPGEYQLAGWLQALGGDSTLVSDLISRRWLLLAGDRIVATLPPDDPAVQVTRSLIFGADSLGFVSTRVDPTIRDGVTILTHRDSFALVLVHRASAVADTVARLRMMGRRMTQQSDANGVVRQSSTMATSLLPSEEAFVHFTDGTLAVARLDPFRVDWRMPDGRWIHGDSLPVPKIPMNRRERRAFEARNPTYRAPTIVPEGLPPPERPRALPEFIPPFPTSVHVVTRGPDGSVLIRRSLSADVTVPTYFVIDRRSRLVGELLLPRDHTVVGVGRSSLYVAATDEDGIRRLQRHPWPF